MNITGKNYIGYELSENKDQSFKPHGGVVNELKETSFFEATENDVNNAVTKAANAFNIYRLLPTEKRIAFLNSIAEGIDAAKEEIIPVAIEETRLALGRLKGEAQRTINQIKLFAQLIKEGDCVNAIIYKAQPERKPLPKADIRQMQIALGPVAVFGASNFPFAFSVAGGDTISALAAGCPVVYKSHPGHPATSELVSQVIIKAAQLTGMPDGVFTMFQGASYESSLQLVKHPLIKAVAFTGSLGGGRALFDAAAKREEPIPVYAEMGSINPVFVLPELIRENTHAIADKLASSNTLSAGQFCTNPGVVVSLQSQHTTEFLIQFEKSISSGNADCMLTDKIYGGYTKSVEALTKVEGIEFISSPAATTELAAKPYMFKTNAETFLKNESLMDEVFGPSSIHVVADDEQQLYAIAEKLHGQLTISVWGTDNDLIQFQPLLQLLELKAGRVICNQVPTGVEVTHAMVHGGPYPATTDSRTTSVGTNAIYRFTRAVCYQNYPDNLLPAALQNDNPLKIMRKVDGKYSNEVIKETITV